MQPFLFIKAYNMYTTQHMYGVCNHELVHTDVSKTEKGAKNYATRHGYKTVSIRYNCGYIVSIIAVKDDKGRWKAYR